MKPIGPFKHIMDNEEKDGSLYEARFQLADDGSPGSEQFFKVSVVTHQEEDCEISIALSRRSGTVTIGGFRTKDIETIARLLYGAARIVTTRVIQPL
mgnify:FL=1